jgi:hypothetical protein
VSLSGACSAGAISGGSIVLHLRLPFRYRIRTYVVETPVQEQVRLRDERVIVEQRPASGGAPSGAGAMQNRDFEVTERHEEPVIEKRAREVEEVVVRREANERVETVRDTVRETKVDVDKEPADRRVGGSRQTDVSAGPSRQTAIHEESERGCLIAVPVIRHHQLSFLPRTRYSPRAV